MYICILIYLFQRDEKQKAKSLAALQLNNYNSIDDNINKKKKWKNNLNKKLYKW